MQTANRYHSNVPTIATDADKARMRANIAQKQAPAYSVADLLKHVGMFASVLVTLAVIL